MKIACCQFNPHIAQRERNERLADQLLQNFEPGDIDILVLPEMAFTGYVFNDLNHIYPYLEDAETGPTVIWARRQALRLNSFVAVGYPQILQENGTEKHYNSCCFVDRQGNLIATYQKSFLYYTDERWADEGPGFISLQIERLGKVGIGICMDLNPYKYRKASAFEFANFHREHQTQIILCPMNWLDSNPSPSERNPQKPQNSTDSDSDDETTSEDENVSWSSLAYWKGRLSPLYANDEADSLRRPKVIFASCNRYGTENGSTFCGTSCVMRLAPSKPELLGYLKKRERGVLVIDVGDLD